MNYAALLRGINVGGNHKVDMKRLKAAVEAAGMQSVRTYINSGNVLFEHDESDNNRLAALLEGAIEQAFGFPVAVLVKSEEELRQIVAAVPDEWRNDMTMKCDVVFLWKGLMADEVSAALNAREGIDEMRTAPGAIIWKVDREHATKSGLVKIVGTPLYRQVTVRNINTTRKLLALLEGQGV